MIEKPHISALFRVFFIYYLLSLCRCVDAFFPRFRGSSASPSSSSKPTQPATVQDASIRIRKTVLSDVPYIAEILAAAVVRERAGNSGGAAGFGWRNRMDQLFAKADIESLLRGRLYALEEGERSWRRICQVYADETEEDRLKIFWSSNERLRGLIEKASADTGEDNLWKSHNFVLTPANANWFNHLQLTAVDVSTGTIAGFCEVAMLSNPAEDDTCRVTTAVVDDADDQERTFSPGITNLVTAKSYRRQGIARRLLQLTERYVRTYWKAERMGLYVEKSNQPAMALYTNLGYDSKVSCDGGDILGEMWYMVKDLDTSSKTSTKTSDEAAFSTVVSRG